jgi:hypothetical protein
MQREEAIKVLASKDAPVFVAELANRVTIIARGAYRGVEEADLKKLKAANETLHVISAKLVGLSRGNERYPGASFLEAIEERAHEAFGADLDWAVADSLDAVKKHHAKSA